MSREEAIEALESSEAGYVAVLHNDETVSTMSYRTDDVENRTMAEFVATVSDTLADQVQEIKETFGFEEVSGR